MIIDARLRPPYKGYKNTPLFQGDSTANLTKSLGFEPSPSAKNLSMESCLKEMDEAGVSYGVVPGSARTDGYSVSNEDIISLVTEYPDRFIGLYGVDTQNVEASLAEIESSVVNGPLKGVNLEPGLGEKPLYANDKSLFPIYELCGEKNIPVMIMIGGKCGPDLSYGNPNIYLHVATNFPKVKFVIAHGGWPFVPPALGPWFWAKNIWVMPDMYFFNCPGMKDYILAASHYMQDNFLYATGYPCVPIVEGAKMFESSFEKNILDKLMRQNAANIFGV